MESRLRFSPYVKDAWILAGPEGLYASPSLSSITIAWESGRGRRVPYSTFTELVNGLRFTNSSSRTSQGQYRLVGRPG